MNEETTKASDSTLLSRIAALEQLLEVYEASVLEQTDKLYREIRERTRIEEELRESRQYLADIIQFYPDATLVIDNQGKVTAWNHAMEELSGIKAAEMIGKGEYEYALPFYGERRPILIDFVALPGEEAKGRYPLIERRGNTLFAEAYIHNAQGEELYFQGHATALRNSSGEVVGAIESVRDITRRKRVEEEVLFKNIILSTQMEASLGGALVVDENETIVLYNRGFVEMWGIPAELIEAGDDAALLRFVINLPVDPDEFLARIRYLYGHREETGQDEIVLKDGRVVDRYSAPMTGADGRYYGRVWNFRDITEQKKLNEELELKVKERTRQLLDAQEELVRKEKLAILGQLSGSVGHELRNPLGVMNNAIYFLKMVHADADETTKEYLDIIKHEIDNAQRIISDLLDFARTTNPRAKTVSARELLDESLGKCVIPENVELRTLLPETLPLLKVDPLQMGQVFQNLITNAVQAMPNGGSLRLRAGPAQTFAEKDLEPGRGYVEISVADTGEGISPNNMEKLFQPLFTTKAKGIGLGLVVCRNLTEANGGRIQVASRPGEGATFTVTLPALVNIGQ